MGGLKTLEIVLDNKDAIYYGGQNLSGHLHIVLEDKKSFDVIKLRIVGCADVHWSESRSSGGKSRTVHYYGHQDYFDTWILCVGKGAADPRKELPAGNYIFPFNVTLPLALPSSFEGAHGKIRYFMKATIDRPWKFDHNTKKMFTVLDFLDLRLNPNALKPVAKQNSKTVCWLCCESGPVEGTLLTDKTGYAPGEIITCKYHVENNCNAEMKGFALKILQTVVFRSDGGRERHVDKVIAILNDEKVMKSGEEYDNELKLQVPATPPSDMRNCMIIDCNYSVVLEVKVPWYSSNLDVEVPVTVGSIPAIHPPTVNDENEIFDADAVNRIPVPTFVGSENDEVNIRDSRLDDGDVKYTPRYHFYDNPAFDSEAQKPSNSIFTTDNVITVLSNVRIG